MFRKNYISLFLFIALFAVGSVSAYGQKTIGGTVQLENAKGKKSNHQGAKIDCYRVDVTESCGSAVSDEKGKFTFEKIPKDAVIVFAVSGPGLSPSVVSDIRLDETNAIIASEGDGATPSEDAVRETALQFAKEKGKLTDAQKANLAEIEKRIAEKAAEAEKAQENNKLRGEYLKDGNAAFNNKDYDLAIEKFTLGYNLDPEFLGGAPVFLNNKAVSLRVRAVDKYNTAAKSKDTAAIRKAKADAIVDFTEALNATTMAYEMTSKGKPDNTITAKKLKEDVKLSKDIIKKIFNIMGQMNVNLASTLSTEADAKKAVSIYKISLGIIPDDADILAGLALALYSAGDFKGSAGNSKASMDDKKESLAYWNKFKKVAPKGHKQQAVADGMIEFLKEEVK